MYTNSSGCYAILGVCFNNHISNAWVPNDQTDENHYHFCTCYVH